MTRYVSVSEQSEEDKKWMREALEMAKQAYEAAEIPVGSVFVRNGEVIARARNRTNELLNVSRANESQRHSWNRLLTSCLSPFFRRLDMPSWKLLITSPRFTHQSRPISHSHLMTVHLATIPFRKQLCMSQSSLASCVPLHYDKLESRGWSSVPGMSDSEVMAASCLFIQSECFLLHRI